MSQFKQELKEKIDRVLADAKVLPDKIIYRENFDVHKFEDSVTADLKIDREKLSEQQSKNPVLYHRYLRVMQDFIKQNKYYQTQFDRMTRLKFEWYKNCYDFTIEKSTEIQIFMKGDDDMLFIKDKLEETKRMVSYLSDVMTDIRDRGYAFKNIIEWEKFRHGE